ncbi:MAG: DUF3108 domain-containing protein [Deltaproteobacteria bacterium]|nr:DUF3108 domain-containing protein [Deltaproteobacteria bacterium]
MRCAWLVVAVIAGVGCATAETVHAPAAPAAATAAAHEALGLVPGETMAYEIKLAGVLAGEAQLAVGEIGELHGRRAIVVHSRAATAGAVALVKKVVDEATTVIDAETGRPIQLDTVLEMGDAKRITATATFQGTVADVVFKKSTEATPQNLRIDFGTQALHDTHSAMAHVRGWRAAPGTSRSVFVVGGKRLWRVDMTYVGTETIGSALGNRRAVVLEGRSLRARRNLTLESTKPSRSFRVWLSDDADRVPLKVAAQTELGEIVMDLVDYQRP